MELPAVQHRNRPTMRDVAALAGVGIKTVSRVVNDVPTVAPELAERVRTAADKLGYRPNLTAASLRRTGGRTGTIGLLLEDVSNPYSSGVHRAVENYARERGALVLAGSLDEDPLREREMIRALIDRRVDGLIVMPAGRDHRYIVAEQQQGTSFVFVDREPSPLLADAVVSDNRGGARRAVGHLHGLPFRGVHTVHRPAQGARGVAHGRPIQSRPRRLSEGRRSRRHCARAAGPAGHSPAAAR